MDNRVLLGMLTPSSNTILEPVTCAMLSGLPDVTAHFGRFRVTEIALGDQEIRQFDNSAVLQASRLLADARLRVITWNGTSAGWLGLERDRSLCSAIQKETGIPGSSSVLALADVFRLTGVTKYGLVTPYLHDVQHKTIDNFKREGFVCVGERHLNDRGNFSYSQIDAATIADMVRDVARSKPQAITIFCTNMRGAPLVADLERETGIPIYDTVSLALWSSLRIAGVDPSRITGWGRLFQEVR